MTDIANFLSQRLDEWEQAAREAHRVGFRFTLANIAGGQLPRERALVAALRAVAEEHDA